MKAIPTPLDRSDRRAGYWWELSMRQVEVSRTLLSDRVVEDAGVAWRH
jgi:hypothetical protein